MRIRPRFSCRRARTIPQVPRLFSKSLRDNVLIGLSKETADLQAALRPAVLERDIVILEEGLETVVGARGVRLSGGQNQRTAAVHRFVRMPELLVFDDPSSALDVETERTLWERLFAHPDITCLVVSHRRSVLQRVDCIVVLKEGRAEAEETFDLLLETCVEMQHLWSGQSDPTQGM